MFDITYIWNLKYNANEYMQKIFTDIENKLVFPKRKRKIRKGMLEIWD